MMNQYKAITRIPHISEPFVDWYEAETEEQALAMWEADRETYGLPVDASVKFEKQLDELTDQMPCNPLLSY